jgi:hypothetical protein
MTSAKPDETGVTVKPELLPCPFCGMSLFFDVPSAAWWHPKWPCPMLVMTPFRSDNEEAIAAWNLRSALSPTQQEETPVAPVVSVKTMKLSGGREDHYVSVMVGDRELTPHVFRIKGRAEYEVAEWQWLLNGAEKPDIMDWLDRTAEPASSTSVSREAIRDADVQFLREQVKKEAHSFSAESRTVGKKNPEKNQCFEDLEKRGLVKGYDSYGGYDYYHLTAAGWALVFGQATLSAPEHGERTI